MVKELPVTVKRAIELIGLFVIGWIVVSGNTVIMPLLMAFFFSLMLLPVFRFFRKLKVPEAIAFFTNLVINYRAGINHLAVVQPGGCVVG